MVALVDDDVPVASNCFVNLALPHDALDHGNVEMAVGPSLAAADLPDLAQVEAKKQGKLGYPLIEQRLPVRQDQRASCPRGHQKGTNHSLANSRWSDENARVMVE